MAKTRRIGAKAQAFAVTFVKPVINAQASSAQLAATDINAQASSAQLAATDINALASSAQLAATDINAQASSAQLAATDINAQASSAQLAVTDINMQASASHSTPSNLTTPAPDIRPAALRVKTPLPLGVWGIISIGSLLTVWWLVTALRWIDPLFLPAPWAVVKKLAQVAEYGYLDATLWQHLWASLQRIGIALLAALLTAIPLGIAIGRFRPVRGLFDPLIEFYRPIPPLAYLPLIVIWCGIGELSKVMLIYLAIFAPVVIATANGVKSVDPAKIRAAQSLGATAHQLTRYVIIPAALPDILTGIRIGLGVGWSTLVAAELIAATRGLGFMVQSAAQFLVTDVVIMGIFVIAAVACVMEVGLRYLQRKWAPWHGRHY